MSVAITRHNYPFTEVSVTNSTSTSGSFNISEKAGGLLHVISCSDNAVTLRFHSVPDTNAGTAFLVRKADAAVVELSVVPNSCYPLPDELFAAKKVIVTTTVSEKTATVRVTMKT